MLPISTSWIRSAFRPMMAVVALLPAPAQAQQANPEVVFFPLVRKHSGGISDFQAFGLFRTETKSGSPRFTGWVMTNREDPNNSASDMNAIRVNGRKLSFSARSRRGLVFRFDGRFLRSGDFRRYFNREVPVLEGTVRKLRHGRQVARVNMRFRCGVAD